MSELSSTEMGMLVWALAVLQLRPDAAMLETLKSRLLVLVEKPDEVTQATWALSDLTPRILLGISQMAEMRMPCLPPPLASTVLWSLARLGFVPDASVVQRLGAGIASGSATLEAPELADLWWALGKLNIHPSESLLRELLARSCALAPTFSAAHVVGSFWGLAQLRYGASSPGGGAGAGEGAEVFRDLEAKEAALMVRLFARVAELERDGPLPERQTHLLQLSLKALRAQGRVPWNPHDVPWERQS
jgi:hypothetical protein